MSELLIVQNVSREGPGLLKQVLHDEHVGFDLVDLDKGQELPPFTDYRAVVVLGGPDSANDETAKMNTELTRIKDGLDASIPYLGICLGLQTLVKAAGGNVVRSEVKEVGFIDTAGMQYTVTLTEDGKSDSLMEGLPEELAVFQLHGETVELTPEMKILATGKFCRNQIVRVAPSAYGIQSHFELTPDMLKIWAEQDPDLVPIGYDMLHTDFAAIQDRYTETGHILLRNFLKIAKLI